MHCLRALLTHENCTKLLLMKISYTVLLLIALALPAQAEIYKRVDADGHVTYSNVPMKGGNKLNLDTEGTTVSGSKKTSATPSNFPKVGSNEQKARDDQRKTILQDELANERKALEDAKNRQAEAASNPEVFKTKDGKTFRNVAKFDEKMAPLNDEVAQHEKNIELLEKELGAIK